MSSDQPRRGEPVVQRLGQQRVGVGDFADVRSPDVRQRAHRVVDRELGSAVLRDVGAMLTDPVRMLAWS
jgi:hypothetical protein